MSNADGRNRMSERKQQILQTAIDIIVEQGYGSLSMRALARASGLKLGALQYHFPTWEDMLRAMVGYISEEYQKIFESMSVEKESLGINEFMDLLGTEPAGGALQVDRLWPQLWAMGQVKPLVADLVDEIYARYMQILEELLEAAGSESPRAEAICLMSVVEGSILFLSDGKRWHGDAGAVQKKLRDFIDAKYGKDDRLE